MNKNEQRTLNGLNTDISWIKTTLIRLEKKMDDRAEKLEERMDKHEGDIKTNTVWRWKVVGIAFGSSTGIALLISVIGLILKFTR